MTASDGSVASILTASTNPFILSHRLYFVEVSLLIPWVLANL